MLGWVEMKTFLLSGKKRKEILLSKENG